MPNTDSMGRVIRDTQGDRFREMGQRHQLRQEMLGQHRKELGIVLHCQGTDELPPRGDEFYSAMMLTIDDEEQDYLISRPLTVRGPWVVTNCTGTLYGIFPEELQASDFIDEAVEQAGITEGVEGWGCCRIVTR